ncbi:MAG: co-chaperone YbbN [Parvularculaceae bacterium]
MRIQSILTVYAFYQGRPVDGSQGALPESQINKFIESLTALVQGDGEGDIADHIDAADAAFEAGDAGGGRSLRGVSRRPMKAMRARRSGSVATSRSAISGPGAGHSRFHSGAKQKEAAVTSSSRRPRSRGRREKALLMLQGFSCCESRARDPNDPAARYELAEAFIASSEMEAAIDELLAIVERDRQWNEEAARKKLVTIFDALGGAHPLTARGRRRLSSILFSKSFQQATSEGGRAG